jgi:hypothetical protein
VDLPEPLAPVTYTTSPGATSSETSFSAVVRPRLQPIARRSINGFESATVVRPIPLEEFGTWVVTKGQPALCIHRQLPVGTGTEVLPWHVTHGSSKPGNICAARSLKPAGAALPDSPEFTAQAVRSQCATGMPRTRGPHGSRFYSCRAHHLF